MLLVTGASALLCGVRNSNNNNVVAALGRTCRLPRQRWTAAMSSSSFSHTKHQRPLRDLYVPLDQAIAHVDEYKFVDGTWFLGQAGRGRELFETTPRIPHASFFDIDNVCDASTVLPHMMPSPHLFGHFMDACGIQQNDTVVIYGQADCVMLHRTWFTFWSFGHDNVKLLQGNLQDWKNQQGPLDANVPISTVRVQDLETTTAPNYQAPPAHSIVTLSDVLQLVETTTTTKSEQQQNTMIVDVRHADRFYGRVAEPRPGLYRGHMPGARHLCFMDLLQQDSLLKDASQLQTILQTSLGRDCLDGDVTMVATCGSGATACVLLAALYRLGVAKHRLRLYDGSWSEYGVEGLSHPVVV